jgi:hypothetical protein
MPKHSLYIPVILESPYSAKSGLFDIKSNLAYAQACMRDCIARGEAPFGSHLLYPQILNDNDPTQRELGISLGYAWRSVAMYSVFYTDFGWSNGMLAALQTAKEERLTYEFRALYGAVHQPPI